MTIKTLILSTSILVSGSVAFADTGFYLGGNISYSEASSTFRSSFESTENTAAIGLTLGYRFEKGTAFFGPEADIDLFLNSDFEDSNGIPCTIRASAPYYCERDATIRLRGVYGQSLNNGLEWFGTAGIGFMTGKGAVGPGPASRDRGVSSGVTVSLGLQKALSERTMLRGEIIYDDFSHSVTKPTDPGGFVADPSYQATTFKIGYILKF